MDGPITFAEALRRSVAERRDKPAFRFLEDGDPSGPADVVSYDELDRRARAIAAGLLEWGLHGERVLLLYPSGLPFIETFVACLYAGVTAVPAPLPAGQAQHVDRLRGIVRDADPRLVLTVDDALSGVSELVEQANVGGCHCTTADVVATDAASWAMPNTSSDALAFLQYTSGATGTPRGVTVSHSNLLHNQMSIQRALGTDGGVESGGWLPYYHDMGLIGQVLGSLFCGGTSTLMSPMAFLARPHSWLDLISRFGIQISGAPSFAYELCVRRVTDEHLADLDLSGWRCAFNGAEPVRASTMNAFAERFAPAGFDRAAFLPCYGMAEATLFVSGAARHRRPTVLTVDTRRLEANAVVSTEPGDHSSEVVGCGHAEDVDVRIVEPVSHEALPDCAIGEIWVRGASVAAGYWRNPEATDAAFGAATAAGETGFLRTGDLGALVDGELIVSGRLKEVIVLRGRNIYPQDVEREVSEAHPALAGRPGAAFGVDGRTGERLIVVQSVRVGDLDGAATSIDVAIRQRLGSRLGIAPGAVLLVGTRDVLRTTSGKIQRREMRRRFLTGEQRAHHQSLDRELAERHRSAAVPRAA